MNIDGIKNGIVIDHIAPGKAMKLYEMLDLETLTCPVAIITNAGSKKMGKKDIIKIDGVADLNFDIVGFIAPYATVNVIENGKIIEKKHIDLPETVVNIIKCKNPRCITTTEQEIEHIFTLTNKKKLEYRCIYCDTKAELDRLK